MAAGLINGLQAKEGLALQRKQARVALPECRRNKLLELLRLALDIPHGLELAGKAGQRLRSIRSSSKDRDEGEAIRATHRPREGEVHFGLNPVHQALGAYVD